MVPLLALLGQDEIKSQVVPLSKKRKLDEVEGAGNEGLNSDKDDDDDISTFDLSKLKQKLL